MAAPAASTSCMSLLAFTVRVPVLVRGSGHRVAVNDTLVGFTVVSGDDDIGKIDHVNFTGTCLSVQTGGLFKKARHLIPASAIRSIDLDAETIDIALSGEQVVEAPEYDEHAGIDEACEKRVEQSYKGLPSR
jgi:hypothetical protein